MKKGSSKKGNSRSGNLKEDSPKIFCQPLQDKNHQ